MESASYFNGVLSEFLVWLELHPAWAGLAVFLISLGESLIVVGLFIPGVAAMFALGALVAAGAMDLWSTIAWAVAGAIAGDGISFWVGHHYREHLRVMWPFRRHPEWLARAEKFFHRHDNKSIIFGRFAGPVRPIIPAVAGMLGMPPVRFYVVNVISALLWAPAYLFPGVVLGASLKLAAGVATRLAVLAVLVIGLLWFTAWLVRRSYVFLQPRASKTFRHFLKWANRTPWLYNITRGEVDPNHPRIRALKDLGVLLILAAITFSVLLAWQIYSGGPLPLDNQINYVLQSLRTPWADHVMVFITEVSNTYSSLAAAAAGLTWLAWRSHWQGLKYWLAVTLVCVAAALALNYVLPSYPPTLPVVISNVAFHNAQITMSIAIYGFLGVLFASKLPVRWRRLPYTVTGIWIVAIIFSCLYLSQHWLSQALISLALGLIWVALLGFVYRCHHTNQRLGIAGLLSVILASLLVVGGGQLIYAHDDNMQSYVTVRPHYTWRTYAWQQSDWQKLPARRIDWGGRSKHPLTLQWTGDLAFLRQHLESQGWHDPQPLNAAAALHWLVPESALTDLPVLPQVHDNQVESLRLVYLINEQAPQQKKTSDIQGQLVLRLWPTGISLEKTPLWVGNVTRQYLTRSFGMISLPRTDRNFDEPLKKTQSFLFGLDWRTVARLPDDFSYNDWDGTVLLVQEKK
ncbi:MAG: hypothetical protein GY862_15205 [Gammaproteobacteria bacterium]|nr:hypothetical protein [Gammaproteobacteria bacterium]